MDYLIQVDHSLLYLIHVLGSSSTLDPFFQWVTDLHKTPWFFPLVIFLLGLWGFRKFGTKGLTLIPLFALIVGLNDFSGNRLTKRVFERPRPMETSQLGFVVLPKSTAHGSSFVSNHSANMFCLATLISVVLGGGWLLYPIAFLIAYSRVYNGVHFPSDVLAGALFGVTLAALSLFILQKLKFFSWLCGTKS